MSQLEVWDYVTMTGLVGLTCCVGLYHACAAGSEKKKRTKEFLVVDRELNLFSLLMSMAATVATAGTITGTVMEIYSRGLIYSMVFAGFLIAPVISAYLYLPVFYQLDNFTVYQYLELRYCKKMKIFISVIQSIKMLFLCSFYLFANALVLNQVSSLSVWGSVWAIGGAVIIYTSLGGFKAVVWTDVIQQTIVFSILLFLLLKGMLDVGGPKVLWERLLLSQRDNLNTWIPTSGSQFSIWTFAIGMVFTVLPPNAINQPLMQRCLSNKTLQLAKICLISGGVALALCACLLSICGAIATARYYNCDPLLMGHIKSRDQIITLFATDTLSFCKGLTGVFLAGLLCATVSSLSSLWNSLAVVTMGDYISPFYPQLEAKTSLRLSKILTALHGLLSIAFVAVILNLRGFISIFFSITSLAEGPSLVIYTVGMLFPWVSTKAVIVGALASMVLPWWATIGHQLSPIKPPHLPFIVSGCSNGTDVIYDVAHMSSLQWFYSISPLWFVSWSLIIGLPVSLLAAKIIGFQDPSKVDPRLLFTFVRPYVTPRDKQEETEIKLCKTILPD